MGDGYYLPDGSFVPSADIAPYAKEAGISVDEYAKSKGFTIEPPKAKEPEIVQPFEDVNVFEYGEAGKDFDPFTGSTTKDENGNWLKPSRQDQYNFYQSRKNETKFTKKGSGSNYSPVRYELNEKYLNPELYQFTLEEEVEFEKNRRKGDAKFYNNVENSQEVTRLYGEGLDKIGVDVAKLNGAMHQTTGKTDSTFAKFYKENEEENLFGQSAYSANTNIYDDLMENALSESDRSEFLKSHMLSEDENLNYSRALDYIQKNKKDFKGLNLEKSLAKVYDSENPLLERVTQYKWDEFENYEKENFKNLTLYKENELKKAAKEYETNKSRNNAEASAVGIYNFFAGLVEGGRDGGRDALIWAGSFMPDILPGGDDWARTQNLRVQMENNSPANNLDYFMASGKGLEIDGITYIKDKDGNIYDSTNGTNVTSLLSAKKYENISKKIDDGGTDMSDFSARGGARIVGNVFGNIAFQLLGTKGIGGARALASTTGIKTVNKLRKFSGAKPINTRARNAKTGKFTSTKETFGINMRMDPRQVDNVMFQSLYGASAGYNNTHRAAIDAGLDNETSEKLARQSQLGMALLYAATGPINPRISALDKMENAFTKKNVFKRIAEEYKKTGSYEATQNLFTKAVKEVIPSRKAALGFFQGGVGETVQENVQQLGEVKLVNPIVNQSAGMDLMNTEFTTKDFIETSILSFAAGGLMGGLGSVNTGYSKDKIGDLLQVSKNIEGAKKRFDRFVKDKKITQSQADKIISDAQNVAYSIGAKEIPGYVYDGDPDAYVKIANINKQIRDLSQQSKDLKGLNDPKIDNQLEKLNNQRIELAAAALEKSNAKFVKGQLGNISKLAGKGVVTTFKTEKEAKAKGIDFGKNTDGILEADGKIYINLEQTLKSGNWSVGSHELLHKILKKEFTIDGKPTALQIKIRDNFKKLLKKNNLLKDIEARMEVYRKQGIDVDNVDMDEYFTAFSDVIAKNPELLSQLKKDKTFLQELKKFIEDLFGGFLPGTNKEFETAEQLFDFIVDYQADIKKGKLSGQAKAKIRAGKKTETTKKKSLSKTGQEASEKALGNIKLEDISSAKSKNIIGKALIGMTEAQIKNRLSLAPDVLEEMKFDLIARTLKDLDRNPWDGRGTLSGYIGQRIKFSLKDIFNDEYKKAPENRLYINQIDNKQLEDFRAQSKIDEGSNNTKPESKKFKKIKDSKVFSPDVITSIENKLLQTLKVLKSTVDIKTTINKSVKPIIAEIKKEMGKQADIDIKAAVGTVGTNLKENFLKSKKATLENAPTTWLATSMPFAVQKSVGGEFTDQNIKDPATGKIIGKVFKPNYTSDWQGKKIDRVKTSTDLAGNTSGNQFIRRVPNVNEKVSDEQFMSYLFPDGKKLKAGRKESWSKMMGEEIAFEIFDSKLNDVNSELTKAFLNNQRIRGAVLADNTIQVIKKDIERGNVKKSLSSGMDPETAAIFIAGTRGLSKGLSSLDLTKATKSNIAFQINKVYGNSLPAKLIEEITKKLMSALGAVRKQTTEEFKKGLASENKTLEEFIESIFEQSDFNESLAALTGVKGSMETIFQTVDKEGVSNVLNSQNVIIESLVGMDTDAALALLKATFNNSGKIGKRDYNNTKEDFRADLFLAEDIIPALQAAGHDIVSFTNVAYTNSKGEVFPRNIKVQSTVNKEHLGNDFDTDESIKNADAAWDFTTKIIKGLKGKSPEVQAMILASMNSGTSTSLRAAAPVLWRTSVLPYTKTNKYRYEHSLPARVVLALMYKNIILGDSDIDLEAVKKDYSVAIIPLEMDKAINDAGFQRTAAIGYIPGVTDPNKRYYNFFTKNKVQFPLQSLVDTKIIIGKDYADSYNSGNKVTAKPPIKPGRKASISPPKDLNKGLNEMIARQKGVKPEAVYSKVVARKKGANKGKYKFFLPSTAEDFRGLTQYTFAGKGKQGEADQKFFEDNLVKPYLKGISAMESQRQALKNDYRGLLKMFPKIKKKLNKEIEGTGFTNDQAARVYLYNKSGFEVPGISKRDLKKLIAAVENDENLKGFVEGLQNISKKDSWVEPSEFWDVGSVLKDLNELSENVSRKDYLEEFIANVDQIFNEDNLNKVEALYGSRHREALEDIIRRMKSGSNRPGNPDRLTGAWLDWVNNSVGTIMFFNRRSALLQMLSFTNFVNWSDNNPLMAAKAFANQPAYWKAWAKIFNSDKLKQRRGGLKSDVQEQEIASQAKNAKDKYSAAVSYLLKIGFTPTQIADSMAIATGGATFLINRTNTYVKQGMSKADAEAKAFEDFSAISDETQQSGDPMLISKQQSSHLGRLILAFQNTPMQYTRLMKKAGQDLINGRGDAKTNISKIVYYGFVQNLIFSTLQQAFFALLPEFDPDDEDEEKFQKLVNTKQERIANSMVDTILRGSGLAGAVVSTLKNTINEYYRQEKKGSFMADHTYTLLQLANVSPPIGSKLRKVYGAIQTKNFDKDVIDARGAALDSPSYEIIGNLLSAGLNIPLDRAIAEIRGLTEALDNRNTAYQRIALALGWRTWDVNAKNEEHELIKTTAKTKRKAEGRIKAAETRKETARLKKEILRDLSKKDMEAYKKYKRLSTKEKNAFIKKEIKKLKNK